MTHFSTHWIYSGFAVSSVIFLSIPGFARQIEVTFKGYSEGCNAWSSPSMMASGPNHSGPANSGLVRNSIDWAHCPAPNVDPRNHSYLWVKGSNTFNQSANGEGEAKLDLNVKVYETGPANQYPWTGVYPHGGAQISVQLDLTSVAERDKEFTFLVNRTPEYPKKGGWISLPNEIDLSTSVKAQLKTSTPSVIYNDAAFDFRNIASDASVRSGKRTFNINYRVVSPEYCTVEERLRYPLNRMETRTATSILRSFVCLELIPSARTKDIISWSDRSTGIHPRIEALERFKQDSSVLDRFHSAPFKRLITQIIERKLKIFYQWANQNFYEQLTQQALQLRDLARILNSRTNPLSFRRMLEAYKGALTDERTRRQMGRELIQAGRERRELSQNTQYLVLIEQIELLISQEDPADEAEINRSITRVETLATELETSAAELIRERDEYRSKI